MPVTKIGCHHNDAGNMTFEDKATGSDVLTLTPTAARIGQYWTQSAGNITAAGGNQATATLCVYSYNVVDSANGTKGVRLPDPSGLAGLTLGIKVHHSSVASLLVYPHSGGYINAATQNTALTMTANTSISITNGNGSMWYSTPLVPS